MAGIGAGFGQRGQHTVRSKPRSRPLAFRSFRLSVIVWRDAADDWRVELEERTNKLVSIHKVEIIRTHDVHLFDGRTVRTLTVRPFERRRS